MAIEKSGLTSGTAETLPGLPAPDAMLKAWSTWLEAASSSAKQWTGQLGETGTPWWPAAADGATGQMLATGAEQWNEVLTKDPMLRSIDQMWNANPLRDVVPVDWAEIARALRTIWLRSMRQPVNAISAVTELNVRLITAATEVWNEAARRWLSGAGPETEAVRRVRQAVRGAGVAQ